MKKTILLIFALGSALLMNAHPVHVSLASIDYDVATGSFNMFLKVYSDDLENDCRLFTGDHELMLYDSKLMPDTAVIRRYIDEKFIFKAGGKRLLGRLGNIESDSEEVRINISYEYSGKGRKFSLKNTIMVSLFGDQTNLLIFRMERFEEGFKFTPDMTEVEINTGKRSY